MQLKGNCGAIARGFGRVGPEKKRNGGSLGTMGAVAENGLGVGGGLCEDREM